ncbi:MAG TPA: right-handed parallel beta-helix repeat-containing protein, partial [Terriglobales bacterium]|nr:right-handed parallel beta-helix repeat-containing protein [Terriglobales bacterium]
MRTRNITAALALLLGSGPVAAQVNCGDVITDDRVMTTDLVCAAHDPAITIDGGSLDMAGHRLEGCLGNGILLIGAGAVRNGSVFDCGHGFVLQGGGGHRLLNVVARGNSGDGIRAVTGENQLTNVTAINNTGDGFDIGSSRNKLTRCASVNNMDNGFVIVGSENKLSENESTKNTLDGFHVTGDKNTFKHNLADNN